MPKSIFSIRKELVNVGRRVYERGYVASNDGNISARLDDNRVVITPTGVSKGFMRQEDMVLVDMDGNVLSSGKKPSSEVYMHLAIYKARPDINSVCHAHPPYGTGFAVAGIPLDKCVLPEVIIVLGSIPLVQYGTPGTDEFFKPVLDYVKDYDAFLLANHGALTIGTDILNAYHKMETLEHFAHIAFVAQQLGHIEVLPKGDVQKLIEARQRYGVESNVSCATCDESGSCTVASGASDDSEDKSGVVPCTGNPSNGSTRSQNTGNNNSSVDKEALVRQVTEAVLKQLL